MWARACRELLAAHRVMAKSKCRLKFLLRNASPSLSSEAMASNAAAADEERDKQEPKLSVKAPAQARLLARLGVLVVRHAWMVSFGCCVAGFLTLMLLPVLAKSIYVDENALLPGSARPTFEQSDALNARRLANELQTVISSSVDGNSAFQKWLISHLDAIGADYYLHPFCPPTQSFSTFGFLTSSHSYEARSRCNFAGRDQTPGVNAIGIIRAPQGEGNEAIVLVTPFKLEHLTSEVAMAMGLSLALVQLLSRSLWLARDIVWVAADGKYGKYTAVAAWLKEYHEPAVDYPLTSCDMNTIPDLDITGAYTLDDWLDDRTAGRFKRAGSIAAGFVLELSRSYDSDQNILTVETEASNGQMPNMDLISIVNVLVSWRQGFQLKLDGVSRVREWPWLNFVGHAVEKVGKEVTEFRKLYLSHSKASYTTAEDYVNGISTLVSSCWKQMLGMPTGCHGAFRDYQVDAITLQVVSANNLNDNENLELLHNFGRLVEGVVRSVNNLLEKFHASVFLYIFVSPNKFVSISTYVVPFALLLVNLPIQAAALCSKSNANGPRHWVHALSVILIVEAWSLGSAILPALLSHLLDSVVTRLFVWGLLSSLGLCLAVMAFPLSIGGVGSPDWYIPLKALTLGLTGIALGIMSAVDFSVALVGAFLLVPMCLSTQPLTVSWRSISKPGAGAASRICALLAPVLTVSPVLILASGLLMGEVPVSLRLVRLWNWTESMWFWGSALYVSLFLVLLPCSIICLYIMHS